MEIWVTLLVGIIPSALTLVGVIVSNTRHHATITQLLNYRMDVIEKKQDAYNNVLSRMQAVETTLTVLDERQKVANHRIDDLEKKAN